MPEGRQFSKASDTVCENSNFETSSSFAPHQAVHPHRYDRPRGLFRAPSAGYHASVSTTLTPREKAALDAGALIASLRAAPQTPVAGQLVELGEHLERAIRAFHMEAIRFRAFTMSRLIKQHQDELPNDIPERMETILHDLEAAGFQTRSVTA